jgi:hypothetical protein
MEDIRYDMSQFYPMKAVLEQLFGRRCYMKLKETGNLKDWKVESERLLRAIEVATDSTVEIADPKWRSDVKDALDLGQRHVAGAESITSLFAHLCSTLTRLVFLQLGCFPNHSTARSFLSSQGTGGSMASAQFYTSKQPSSLPL